MIEGYLFGKDHKKEKDVSYIGMVLYRLLKDYMRVSSIPFGETLQEDLLIQLKTSVEALVVAAEEFHHAKNCGRATRIFDERFSHIVDAVSCSIQAASQMDRLCFEEQRSHLDNTGAYHKVLLAYYGIVKDVLALIYMIPRKRECTQSVLVPLLSFGHTPVVCSCSYEAHYDGLPAKLVCITMPYQAFTNLPKYIGMLVHELFHYSAPSDRGKKNETAGMCLTAAAFLRFLTLLGEMIFPDGRIGGHTLFYQWPQLVLESVHTMFETIHNNQKEQYAAFLHWDKPDLPELPSAIFFQTIREALTPCADSPLKQAVEDLYCRTWLLLREKLMRLGEVSGATAALFALDGTLSSEEALLFIRERYRLLLPHARKQIQSNLFAYERALCELPPDLFDIDFVLSGESNDEKVKQYLWQIHSIRSDKRVNADIETTQYDGNDIRIGALLDYFVFGLFGQEKCRSFSFSQRQAILDEKLSEWFDNSQERTPYQKEERRKAAMETRLGYGVYQSESLFAAIMLRDYFIPVRWQLAKLQEHPEARSMIRKLSRFYIRYCKTLDHESGAKKEAALFDLSIEMMESFQAQPSLEELNRLCWQVHGQEEMPEISCDPVGSNKWITGTLEFRAFHPKDLSRQIISAYHSLCPNGKNVPLWFRGESKADRTMMPGIMRKSESYAEDGFVPGMRKLTTLAKAKILPRGEHFHQAEWLALLQHYGFKTNLLDWSENFTTALFFATEKWQNSEKAPKNDAVIHILNPILLNLAAEMLEERRGKNAHPASFQKAMDVLCTYLRTGKESSPFYPIPLFTSSEEYLDLQGKPLYSPYYDFGFCERTRIFPLAAATPMNSDRIKAQTGAFVFFPLHAKPRKMKGNPATYRYADLYRLQKKYFVAMYQERKRDPSLPLPIPFLCKVSLNASRYMEFVDYIRAIGLRKFQIYPELDNLVKDIEMQSFESFHVNERTSASVREASPANRAIDPLENGKEHRNIQAERGEHHVLDFKGVPQLL